MVHRIKEFPHIALQNIAGSRVILAFFPEHRAKCIYSLMRSLANTTRIRIGNERWFKSRIENFENSVMENSIPDSCFMNMPALWVGDKKALIMAMFIIFISQTPM